MLSASGRPEPPPEATLVVESPRFARRFPGLGRWLGVAALLAFLVPFGVGSLAGVLHELTGIAILDQVRDLALELIGFGVLGAISAAALGGRGPARGAGAGGGGRDRGGSAGAGAALTASRRRPLAA